MKLQHKEDHLSIDRFNDIEIPDFTVLTGINGSGKSHLLRAIENGKVGIGNGGGIDVVYFNYESFRLEDESTYTPHQLTIERRQAWEFFNQSSNGNIVGNITRWKDDMGEDLETFKAIAKLNNKALWQLTMDDLPDANKGLFSKLKVYKHQVSNHFKTDRHLVNNNYAQGIFVLLKKLDFSIDEIDEESFKQFYKAYSFENDFLPKQLGKSFTDYYSRYEGNQYYGFRNEKHSGRHPVLTSQEFVERYGEKPWDLTNEILKKFGTLPYRVNSPEGIERDDTYQLQLLHTAKEGVRPQFSELSSGERTLIALVASIYKSSSDSHFPDVLLLDEIDASLHPSMIKNLLDVVNEVFLQKSMKVVLATHSPTMIALAPNESIYVVNSSGENRIEKKSREDALNILTEGFATLNEGKVLFEQIISSSKDVVLFVEGKTDVKHLKTAAKKLEIHGDSFDIFHCRNADKLRQFLVGIPSGIFENKKIVGIFDYDDEGIKNIKKIGEEIEENKQYKVRDMGNVYAITLPCPDSEFEKHRNCPIEFLYPEEILREQENFITRRELGDVTKNLNQSEWPNQEQLNQKTELYYFRVSDGETSKKEFADYVTKLDPDKFESFKTVFKKIEELTEIAHKRAKPANRRQAERKYG